MGPRHPKPSGVLYVRTDALIDRHDLIGIQSATDQTGGGILVLIRSDTGFRKMRAATTAYPGLRLALVVGQTMLAAPSYTSPIHEQQLAFSVGSASNAERAARSVAGVQ
ncbi:Preprotein translocase subunit SecD OS=Castellaniella defragrans OX=75697 GN=HNR28_001584 PE=4 SV=1 [Castellaniella defragrans]